jgi:bestrophin-3
MLTIVMYIHGSDNESKLLRKTLMQNCNLMAVLVFRSISESVRTRLRTLEDVVNAGDKLTIE